MEIHLLDRDWYQGRPDEGYRWLRDHAPVYRDPLHPLWGLCRHEDVVWAERHPALLSNAGGSRPRSAPQPSMIDRDDPWHSRQRHLVAKGFTPKRVAGHEAHVREVMTALIDRVAADGSCDLVADVAARLPMALIGGMLGARSDEWDVLQRWSDEMIAGADGPENVTDAVVMAAVEFHEWCTAQVAERRYRPHEDLIGILATAEVDGERLSDEEAIANALLLLVGGNETTRNVISGGVHALLTHRDQWELLQDEPERIPGAVEECLRWVSPILNMARSATEAVEIRGVTVPTGEQVLLMYASANRDERVFGPTADRFDVTREPNHHVAFGFGPHFCLGSSLARLEIRVALEELTRRLPDLRLAEPGADPPRSHSSFVRGITSLPVAFTRR